MLAWLLVVLSVGFQVVYGTAVLNGETKRWHKVELTWLGPFASETGDPNPFLDYRLTVTFAHSASGKSLVVPGFFAADGDAAETSATEGDQWRVNFSPDELGTWEYTVSFVTGANVAVSNDPGTPMSPDGDTGSFVVTETDKSWPDFRQRGRLIYVGERYLKFAGTNDYFLKLGSDSPEGLLDFEDFDNTPELNPGQRRSWSAHLQDWKEGDPTWQEGKGKGLIGAINYLSGRNLNAVSFLTHSYLGSDGNVFIYLGPKERFRIDISKLDQWGIVFDHMTTMGIFAHFKFGEAQSLNSWDNGTLGIERKLYYRELVSRFSHLLALNWNLGEEVVFPVDAIPYTNERRIKMRDTAFRQNRGLIIPIETIKSFASYIVSVDPYGHNVALHTYPTEDVKGPAYEAIIGFDAIRTASLQSNSFLNTTFEDALRWVNASTVAGSPLVVTSDEQGPWESGILADSLDPEHDLNRSSVLWPHFLAGGAGFESYAGWWFFPQSDLSLNDYRSRDKWWTQMLRVFEFFLGFDLPFWEMQGSRDISLNGQYTFFKAGSVYVTQLQRVQTSYLDLGSDSLGYRIHWWDPKYGGDLQDGSIQCVSGGGLIPLGSPPAMNYSGEDWLALIRPDPNCDAAGNPYTEGPCMGVQVSSRVVSFDRFASFTTIEFNLKGYPNSASLNDAGVEFTLDTGLCVCDEGANADFTFSGSRIEVTTTMQGWSIWLFCKNPEEISAPGCKPIIVELDGNTCAVSGSSFPTSLKKTPGSILPSVTGPPSTSTGSPASTSNPSTTPSPATSSSGPASNSSTTPSPRTTDQEAPTQTSSAGVSSNNASSSSSTSSGSACFPGDALVELESGKCVSMAKLKIGDRVRVDQDTFSEVFFFGHKDASQTDVEFIRLLFQDSRIPSLEVSHAHLVYVLPDLHDELGSYKNPVLQRADQIRVGMHMISLGILSASPSKSSSFVRVAHIERVRRSGLYNPHTLDGDIVVNGIRVSSFTGIVPPRLGHLLLLPERLSYLHGYSLLGTALYQSRQILPSSMARVLSQEA